MDLGVASFATDYPDVIMQAIRDYYAQASGSDPKKGVARSHERSND
jgi:hypothetical protein